MSEVTISPATAVVVIRLPSAFASVWSPGFDLSVKGEGATPEDARLDLVFNLRVLGRQLVDRAQEIEANVP